MEETNQANANAQQAATPLPSALPAAPTPKKRGRPRKQQMLSPIYPAAQMAGEQPATPQMTGAASNPTIVMPTQSSAPNQMKNKMAFTENTLAKPARTKKRPKGKKLKLTQFDKDALKMVRRNFVAAQKISEKLGVGVAAVEQRLQEIEDAGLLAKNSSGEYHITVAGYNEYSPDSLETSLEQKERKRVESLKAKEEKKTVRQNIRQSPITVQATESATSIEASKPQNEIIVLSENPSMQTPGSELQERKESEDKVDLSELLARGAPKPGENYSQNAAKPLQKAKRSENTVAEITIPTKPAGTGEKHGKQEEKCILCRTGFLLSVGGGNPKYGHCFCGAAYHKDCYDGVSEASGECIQCGKKLDIIIDKASLDEVRKIKDVFG